MYTLRTLGLLKKAILGPNLTCILKLGPDIKKQTNHFKQNSKPPTNNPFKAYLDDKNN